MNLRILRLVTKVLVSPSSPPVYQDEYKDTLQFKATVNGEWQDVPIIAVVEGIDETISPEVDSEETIEQMITKRTEKLLEASETLLHLRQYKQTHGKDAAYEERKEPAWAELKKQSERLRSLLDTEHVD